MKILLICSNGLSTSLLRRRMEVYIAEKQLNDTVKADNEDNLPYVINDYDVIMVAPQLSHRFQSISSSYIGYGKVFIQIPGKDYGLANGEKIIELARTSFEEKHPNGKYNYEDEIFHMINCASQGKKEAFNALDYVEKKQYAKAAACIKAGRRELIPAHEIQSRMIASQTGENGNTDTNTSLLLVHAEDIMMSAVTTLDLVERMIGIFEKR